MTSAIYFFMPNLIIINKKNCPPLGFNRNQPNRCGLGWVGLGWTYVISWVGLGWIFLTHLDGFGQKISSTRPNPAHTHPYLQLKIYYENIGKNMVSITFLVQSHHFSSIKEAYQKGPNKRQDTTGIPTRVIVEKL